MNEHIKTNYIFCSGAAVPPGLTNGRTRTAVVFLNNFAGWTSGAKFNRPLCTYMAD